MIPTSPLVGFNLFVLAMLAVDLLVFHRHAHEVRAKEAAAWSAVWVALALTFNLGLYWTDGCEVAPPWTVADLPAPPPFGLRNIFAVIGPGAIMAATSIGGGEWLVGPAAAVLDSASRPSTAPSAVSLYSRFKTEGIVR